MSSNCPYNVGDKVKFKPSDRTRGLYQNIDGFGISIGEVITIGEIQEDCYLYSTQGKGGWPWNEFEAVE